MISAGSPEPMSFGRPETCTAELVGYGRMAWAEFLLLLGDAEAAWADYDGFHVGHAPGVPPPYTHMWAWTSDWLIRARIEGDRVIAGALVLGAAPARAPAPQFTEQVSYEPVAARTWDSGEKRVGPVPAGLGDRAVDTYLIPGERPVTFVSMTRPSGAQPDNADAAGPESDHARN